MGQAFKKPASASSTGRPEGKKEKEIREIIDECYKIHFEEERDYSESELYRAIFETVEKINHERGYTQVTPKKETLREAYFKEHKPREQKMTKEEFQKIMEKVVNDAGVTGVGVKDTLLYIFGVPASATFLKNALMPNLVSNEVLIPGMTSLTVLVLAKLNKI